MNKFYFFGLTYIIGSLAIAFPQYGLTAQEKETTLWLWQKAQRFSQIQSIKTEEGLLSIPIFLLTEDELSAEVCPEDPKNCRGLAALFDTTRERILLRSDLNPDTDMISASYLLHEMVHGLQHETKSDDELFGTCQKLYNTEKQAYDAQDAFLKSEGQFFRAGTALRFFNCKDPAL